MSKAPLNVAQRAAVRTLRGPLLVLAGAGTGKTRVITFRIAALIQSGIAPSRILAVTFTNKAAREMRDRVGVVLGPRRRSAKPPEISTFHSLCVRILRRHITRLGYPAAFSIYNRGDQEALARGALRDIRVGHEKLRPGDLIAQIGTWKSLGLSPEPALERAENDRDSLAAMAYARYQAALRASGAVDFDDLLLLTGRLFEERPDVRFAESSRFDHVLIDEYQDTNGLQYGIVKALAGAHRNLCVVGDDDQSIYAWRGAEVTHILSFQRDWPEAKVVKLEDNYRSTEAILGLANMLIGHNRSRHDKVLRSARGPGTAPRFVRFEDEAAEAESVVREIRVRIDPENPERVLPSSIAVLFRTNEQPRPFELELRRARVPYVLIGGQSFYDRKEIRDVVAYLKVFVNPNDEVSLLRIINTPARGIGTSSVEGLLAYAVSSGEPLWQALPHALSEALVPEHVAGRVQGFVSLVNRYRGALTNAPLAETLKRLIEEIDYRGELERTYKSSTDVEARSEALEELVNAAARYEARADSPSLLGFLEETALAGREDNRDDTDKRQAHAITLMTLHSAKGLEFAHVYLVGLEEGLLPHKRSVAEGRGVDEERRLCYVGVTRAQDSLVLSFCRNRTKWGKLRPTIPSRFLFEMRGESERALRMAEAAAETFTGEDAADRDAAPQTPARRGKNVRRRPSKARRAPRAGRAR